MVPPGDLVPPSPAGANRAVEACSSLVDSVHSSSTGAYPAVEA